VVRKGKPVAEGLKVKYDDPIRGRPRTSKREKYEDGTATKMQETRVVNRALGINVEHVRNGTRGNTHVIGEKMGH